MGSKARIAPEILPIILDGRKEGQYYVEPFCGGCNSLQFVSGNRIAGDLNKYLIAMWKGLQADAHRPREITKEMYHNARIDRRNGTNDYYSDFEIGWIGFMASFNGKFFEGFSGNYPHRDYTRESIDNIEKQIDSIRGVEFHSAGYEDLAIPAKSIIYCDIPYRGASKYAKVKGFDHDRFWEWCAIQKKMVTEFMSANTQPLSA